MPTGEALPERACFERPIVVRNSGERLASRHPSSLGLLEPCNVSGDNVCPLEMCAKSVVCFPDIVAVTAAAIVLHGGTGEARGVTLASTTR